MSDTTETTYQYTEAELARKIDYEGGVFEAVFGYGIKPTEVEPGVARDAFQKFYAAWEDAGITALADAFRDALDTAQDGWE